MSFIMPQEAFGAGVPEAISGLGQIYGLKAKEEQQRITNFQTLIDASTIKNFDKSSSELVSAFEKYRTNIIDIYSKTKGRPTMNDDMKIRAARTDLQSLADKYTEDKKQYNEAMKTVYRNPEKYDIETSKKNLNDWFSKSILERGPVWDALVPTDADPTLKLGVFDLFDTKGPFNKIELAKRTADGAEIFSKDALAGSLDTWLKSEAGKKHYEKTKVENPDYGIETEQDYKDLVMSVGESMYKKKAAGSDKYITTVNYNLGGAEGGWGKASWEDNYTNYSQVKTGAVMFTPPKTKQKITPISTSEGDFYPTAVYQDGGKYKVDGKIFTASRSEDADLTVTARRYSDGSVKIRYKSESYPLSEVGDGYEATIPSVGTVYFPKSEKLEFVTSDGIEVKGTYNKHVSGETEYEKTFDYDNIEAQMKAVYGADFRKIVDTKNVDILNQ